MKKVGQFLVLGAMTASLSFAQVDPYTDGQNPMGVPQDEQNMEETPQEFPEDEFYTPEEMTPEEQEDRKMIQGEEEWELGEPLPSDEEVPLNPEEEYDSF